MSTHPNAILLLTLKPDGLARKTFRAILADEGIEETSDPDIKIGETEYHAKVMENDYDDGYQIAADEGDIVLFDMITYGYGERMSWDILEAQKNALDEWAAAVCEKHHCQRRIWITANYW